MIYLNAEVVSGLGEDTFWTWFKREFPSSSFDVPRKLHEEDCVLRYSTLGFLPIEGKQIAICWELYFDLRSEFDTDQWDLKISKINQTARYSTYRTVATQFTQPFYKKFGSVDVIPIGVDTEIFKPLGDKKGLRAKYGIPIDKKVGIWVGTNHPMKGFSTLIKYAKDNPEIHWIVVWKWEKEACHLLGASNFVKVKQESLAELHSCADFFLSTSKLQPYYMAEWEAMACNLPIVIIDSPDKEFTPSRNPRDDVFNHGWDRGSVKRLWSNYLSSRGVQW